MLGIGARSQDEPWLVQYVRGEVDLYKYKSHMYNLRLETLRCRFPSNPLETTDERIYRKVKLARLDRVYFETRSAVIQKFRQDIAHAREGMHDARKATNKVKAVYTPANIQRLRMAQEALEAYQRLAQFLDLSRALPEQATTDRPHLTSSLLPPEPPSYDAMTHENRAMFCENR